LIAVGGTAAAMADGANAADPDGAAMRWTVDDVDAAAERLAAVVRPGDVVLVKASRSAGLERVVDRLAALLGDDTGGVGERGA
jgi:UDP-N-acetylmuramoyl-tripeptide--D-alanyl-D-alanine ligase